MLGRRAPELRVARVEKMMTATEIRPHELIVAVVGPTASGKSDLALDLCESLPAVMGVSGSVGQVSPGDTGAGDVSVGEVAAGELVSADALQFYRGMDIGTAKTPVEERRGIPHHQIDVLDVWQEASVAAYQQAARADIAAIHARGNVAVVAGGSGLYQRALLDVIDFPGTDPAVRARLEAEAQGPLGSRGLHERLRECDPVAAERIDPHNARRIVRALEVIELTGKPFSANMPRHEFIHPAVMVAIRWDMADLDARIAVRTRLMFEQGLIEETRALLDEGLREAKTASRATGYAQAIAVIDGDMTVPEAIESVALATRQLARRQVKWLRPDPRVVWIDAEAVRGEGAAFPTCDGERLRHAAEQIVKAELARLGWE